MANNTNTARKSNSAAACVDTITDNAFVPNMEKKAPLTADQKMAAFFDSISAERISTPVFTFPANGKHNVIVTSYEMRNGYRGSSDYFVFALKDAEKNITWNMTLPAEAKDVMAFLGDINMYNKGMVYLLDPLKAFGKLQSREFTVWTQQYKNDKGEDRVKTYVNPDKYEKFANFISYKKTNDKKKEEEYKEKKNNEKAEI